MFNKRSEVWKEYRNSIKNTCPQCNVENVYFENENKNNVCSFCKNDNYRFWKI